MANYQILKADIDEKIYENAQQKITGENLNSILNAMVATLGAEYQFAGVATIDTNPETSDAKVFYIANGKGKYTYFGGVEVTEDGVVILYYDTSWHKVATGIASNEKLSELEEKVVSGGLVDISYKREDFEIYQVNPGESIVTSTGSRLRVIKKIPAGCTISVKSTKGRGAGCVLYSDLGSAIIATDNPEFIVQNIHFDYTKEEINDVANKEGYLCVSLSKEDGSSINITDYDELINGLDILVTKEGQVHANTKNIEDIKKRLFAKELTKEDFNTYKVLPSSTIESPDGNRLRLVKKISKGAVVSAYNYAGKGIACMLYESLEYALYFSNTTGVVETIAYNYTSNFRSNVIKHDGYLSFALSKEDGTKITDEDERLLLANTGIFVKYESENANDINILNNSINDSLLAASRVGKYYSGDYTSPISKKGNLSLAVITDIHGTSLSLERFMSFSKEKTYMVDYNVCLGDIVLRQPNEGTTWFDDSIKKSIKPFLYVVGNHDVGDTGLSCITEPMVKSKYFQSIISRGDITNFMANDKCSWYVDNNDYKIRIIGLFEYGNGINVESGAAGYNIRRWIPSDTLQWFADTLYNTPIDYNVVILLHQVPYESNFIDCNFTIKEQSRPANPLNLLNCMNGNAICDVVDAYVNGKSFNKTYNDTYSLGLISSVQKDFSNRGVGKFMCYLCGHVHGSYIVKDKTYPYQKTVCVPSGSRSVFQQSYGDMDFVDNTINQDNFYFISFDTNKRKVNIVKIGGHTTNDMSERNYISLDLDL